MMTDEERRKVFWLLKKYSSWTGWNALAQAYFAFADAWLQAMRKADDIDIDEFNQNATKYILDGRIAFEKGLALLKRGERTVFLGNLNQSFKAWGYLTQGAYQLNFIRKIMDPEEYIFDWMKNKEQVILANDALQDIRFGQESVLEREDENVAPEGSWNVLATFHPVYQLPMNDPKHMNFPEVLAPVPMPSTITVETDSEVPFYGIYEPEWGAMTSAKPGPLSKLKTVFTGQEKQTPSKPTLVGPDDEFPPPPRREHIGCMNYLLAGTKAPYYKDEEHGPVIPVTWRLIWKDTRYLDGTIPEEEAEYLAPVKDQPIQYASKASRANVTAGESCPEAGWWFTPAKADSRRYFKQGDIMPNLGGDYGQTFWQWAPDQSAPTP
jgi:hypothetical protein